MEQSYTSGGTAHILPAERAKASFDVEKLTNVLDGGQEFTAKRRWIQRAHDEALSGASSSPRTAPIVHADRSRSDLAADSMKHFMDVHWEHLQRGYRPRGQDMSFMSSSKFGMT